VYLNPNCDYFWKFYLNGVGIIDHKVAREAGIDFYSSEDMEVIVIEEMDEQTIEAAIEEAMVEMEEEKVVAKTVEVEEESIELEPSANDRLGLDSDDDSSVPSSVQLSVPSSVQSSVPSSVQSSVPLSVSSSVPSNVSSSIASSVAVQSVAVSQVDMAGLISQLVSSLEEPIRRIAQETAQAVVGDAVQQVRKEMDFKRKSSVSTKTVNKKQRK
jgi:hypothetical protein